MTRQTAVHNLLSRVAISPGLMQLLAKCASPARNSMPRAWGRASAHAIQAYTGVVIWLVHVKPDTAPDGGS